MFEKQSDWKLPATLTAGTKNATLGDLRADLNTRTATERTHRGLSCAFTCADCNWPGGGKRQDLEDRAKRTDTPVAAASLKDLGEDTPCHQTVQEQSRCPQQRDTLQAILHHAKVCDPWGCDICRERGGAGTQLKVGEVVKVFAMTAGSINDIPALLPIAFYGRYLGKDAAGLRFEQMLSTGGTHKRFWIQPSQLMIQDLVERDEKILAGETVEPAKSPAGIILPTLVQPPGRA